MMRDDELIRSLLLWIEKNGNDVSTWIEDAAVEGYSDQQIDHHISLLGNSGYVIVKDLSCMDETCYRPRRLTWFGYEFAKAICDRGVWEETLDIAEREGIEELSALYDIAKKVAAKKQEQVVALAM